MDDRFSARRGTYRVIYWIDDKARVVTVVDVAHRRDVYEPELRAVRALPNSPYVLLIKAAPRGAADPASAPPLGPGRPARRTPGHDLRRHRRSVTSSQARRPIQLPAPGADRQRMRLPVGVARDGFASRDGPDGLSEFDICEDFCYQAPAALHFAYIVLVRRCP